MHAPSMPTSTAVRPNTTLLSLTSTTDKKDDTNMSYNSGVSDC